MNRTLYRMLIIASIMWTAICMGSLAYHIHDSQRHILNIANETARESIQKDMLYRYWAAGHGSVYVPVTKDTPPNPYLVSVKERDITTPSGRRLTLMNPDYMTRQIHELGTHFTDVQGHMTSLRPIRPENAPDVWEAKALRAIEAGEKEYGETVDFEGGPHYRLMLPLYTERTCMKCHMAQGHQLGALSGGLSAAIPMATFTDVSRDHLLSEVMHFGAIWVLGLAGAGMVMPFVRRRIREQEQAEDALRRNWEFTQSIIENEPECVKILGPGGELKFMNRAGLAMIDADSLDQVLGRKVHDLVVQEHREAFVRLNERVFAGESGSLEFAVVGLRGKWRWLETHAVPLWDAAGKVELLLGITRDITHRKQSEHTLQESEALYRSLVETTSAVAWEVDISTMMFTYVSPQIAQLSGYPAEQWTGFAFWVERIHPDDRASAVQYCQAETTKGVDHAFEYRMITASGKTVWVRDVVSVIKEQERTVSLRGYFIDITERKRAEQEREHLEQQLLQAQKIESVGRLAGGIAHDINNMLTPILGYAELLSYKIPTGDERREDLAEITSAATRVKELTQQLLAFARKQTLDVRPVDVNVVISRFGKMLRRTLRDDILIKLNLALSVGTVLADEGQLEQVLMNLVVNAQDAMTGGGAVTITTEDVVVDASFARQRPGLSSGRYVVIRVADTGMGMDSGTLARMFEPFFTTKDPGQGTGLGLAMVYGIIKQHKGYVDVQSQPRQGSTFSLYLPVTDEALGQEQEATGERTAPLGGQETILVIEDEEQVLRLVTQMLGEWGYRVLAALSGREALEKAGTFSGEIHLVISDVIMPDMNGKEVLEKLREVRQNIKVLYMSGYAADVISSKGVLDSGVNFLRKPFTVHGLAAKVRQVLDGSGR